MSKTNIEKLIIGLPKDVKNLIIVFAGATMDAWEIMDEEDKESYGNNPGTYLGEQILMASKVILEEDD
jgi:hypothetical protein